MKQFFEEIIKDSVTAVKDEMLARLAESRQIDQNLRNVKRENNPGSENDKAEEFPIVRYPNRLTEEKTNVKNEFEKNNAEDRSSTINMSIAAENFAKPVSSDKFFPEKKKHADGDSKIGIMNAYNKNRRLNIMVIGAVFGLVFCLLMLTFYKDDLPGEVVGIISTVSGIFGSCLKDAYSFEFGSSRGSKDKDDKITSTILEKLKI